MKPWKETLIGCIGLLLSTMSTAQEKYNVLFIAVDGLNPSVLSAYGNTYSHTPNFQALADRGLVFRNAFSQQSSCAPSRASLMTGYRPDTLNINTGSVHFRDRFPDVTTFPQLFKQNGYYTRAIGLVSHAHPAQPDDSSWNLPETMLEIFKRDEYLMPENRIRGFINPMEKGTATEGVDAPDNAYQDGQVAQLTIETLAKIKDKPFLLAMGFKRPHLPYTAPKKYWDLYQRGAIPMPADSLPPSITPAQAALRYAWSDSKGEMRAYTDIPEKGPVSNNKIREILHGYYASVSYVDAQIGRVLQALDSLNLSRKTIIVLWSDHGNHLGERGLWGKNDLSDDANRIPFIIVVPGAKSKGLSTDALIETVDVYPTLTELCGLAAPAWLEGRSLKPLIEKPNLQWKEAVFSRYPRQSEEVMGYSVRSKQYRYSEYVELSTGKILDRELYDIIDDPQHYHNLLAEPAYRKILGHMKKLLDGGWRQINVDLKSN